jgi:hypothetical protein
VLFDNNIIVVAGENPQGAPAFQHLSHDQPANEFEFVSLWKLYILTLAGQAIKSYGLTNDNCKKVVSALEDADLLPSGFSLAKAIRFGWDYVKSLARPEAIENEVGLDPITGLPTSLRNKIYLREPGRAEAKLGAISIDEMFKTANEALDEAGISLWIVLDRLDVAFAGDANLETNALRALFKFYLDTKQYSRIRPKIFLRSDIWSSITSGGFREASHIERSLTIDWKEADLLNLVVRRFLANEDIFKMYGIDRDGILSRFESQKEFLYSVFPDQVESGRNKPATFDWMLSRTADASRKSAPREIVHFLAELRDVQISRLERGEKPPTDDRLFEPLAFKEALPAVSKVRLEQTLYAEYPDLKPQIEALKEQKATQNLSSLAGIWAVTEQEAQKHIAELERIGFFERFGAQWRVPFLYRSSLGLIMGAADND